MRSDLFCQVMERHDQGTYFSHFMANAEVTRLYDAKRKVYAAIVEMTEETPDCYWGWWNKERQCFTHIYPWKGGVEMCFPYGTKPEAERGKGCLLPVKITLGAEVPKKEGK